MYALLLLPAALAGGAMHTVGAVPFPIGALESALWVEYAPFPDPEHGDVQHGFATLILSSAPLTCDTLVSSEPSALETLRASSGVVAWLHRAGPQKQGWDGTFYQGLEVIRRMDHTLVTRDLRAALFGQGQSYDIQSAYGAAEVTDHAEDVVKGHVRGELVEVDFEAQNCGILPTPDLPGLSPSPGGMEVPGQTTPGRLPTLGLR